MKALIDRIHARIRNGQPNDYPDKWLSVQPPVLLEAVVAAEAELGFPLPELLRRLYTQVGNGGFGPGYGLIPLSACSATELDLVGGYAGYVEWAARQGGEGWPERLVPAFFFGCTVFEFVDCRDQAGPVVDFAPGAEELAMGRAPERVVASSLECRLESWLAGEPVAW